MKACIVLILVFLSLPLLAETVLTYEIINSPEGSSQVTVLKEPGNKLRFRSVSEDSSYNLLCNADYSTISYYSEDKESGFILDARLENNEILVNGFVEGKEVSGRLEYDGKVPWYQSFNHQFGDFAISGEKKRKFCMLRPDNLEMMEWQLKRLGTETIETPIGRISAVKVKVSLTGLLAAFWSAECWYREDDGRFVKYEGPMGGPGAETAVSVLVSEE